MWNSEELIVDATAALLIRQPDRFDVIVTTNMFGDILSDEASELCGSLGLGGSISRAKASVCPGTARLAPDIQGRDKANPTSLILSAAMLLDWLATRHDRPEFAAAAWFDRGRNQALDDPGSRTRDLGGHSEPTRSQAAYASSATAGSQAAA